MHPLFFRALFLFSAALFPGFAQAKDQSPEAQLEIQAGSDLLSSKASVLEAALIRCIEQNRNECHKFASAILRSGRADANAIAPYLVAASIRAVGKDILEHELTGIIYETVKATPDAVLEIVDASARSVSQKLVPVIVSAAIHAVPDPYKIVEAVRKTSNDQPTAPKTDSSFKSVHSYKEDYKSTPKDEPYAPDSTQTLAEAIVATASNASGVTDTSAIVAAADSALGKSLVRLLGGPGTTSPVGIVGDPNYGNEPRPPVVSK